MEGSQRQRGGAACLNTSQVRTVLSQEPEASSGCVGEKASATTGPSCAASTSSIRAVRTAHTNTWNVSSEPAHTTCRRLCCLGLGLCFSASLWTERRRGPCARPACQLMDAPTMTGAFFGVSVKFLARSGGLSSSATCSFDRPGYVPTHGQGGVLDACVNTCSDSMLGKRNKTGLQQRTTSTLCQRPAVCQGVSF